jgi:hypothetical protein
MNLFCRFTYIEVECYNINVMKSLFKEPHFQWNQLQDHLNG